jgi:hypothetical protein
MDVHSIGVLLGMGGVYTQALLDMGGVLGPPLLFHSWNSWAHHCRFIPTIVRLAIVVSFLQRSGIPSLT